MQRHGEGRYRSRHSAGDAGAGNLVLETDRKTVRFILQELDDCLKYGKALVGFGKALANSVVY